MPSIHGTRAPFFFFAGPRPPVQRLLPFREHCYDPAYEANVARRYSRHQQSLIRNFYKNRDAIETQRLQEIVTEIYLAGKGRKADRLWTRAADILQRAPDADAAEIARLVEGRDLETLAKIAGARFGG